jgi:VanZ family protein
MNARDPLHSGIHRRLGFERLWHVIGFLAIVALVVLSLVPLPRLGPDIPDGDKIGHFAAYGLIGAWYGLLLGRGRRLLAAAFGLIGIGLILESLQGLTGYRQTDLMDAAANALGVAIGTSIAFSPLRDLLFYVDLALRKTMIKRR